jgi:hypothetical protein
MKIYSCTKNAVNKFDGSHLCTCANRMIFNSVWKVQHEKMGFLLPLFFTFYGMKVMGRSVIFPKQNTILRFNRQG